MTDDDVVLGQSPEPLDAAAADLGHLRQLLIAAGDGKTNLDDLKESLREYVATHGPAIRAAATALTEEVRVQTVDELYNWRDQLDAQLNAGMNPLSSSAAHAGSNETSGAAPSVDKQMEQNSGKSGPAA